MIAFSTDCLRLELEALFVSGCSRRASVTISTIDRLGVEGEVE